MMNPHGALSCFAICLAGWLHALRRSDPRTSRASARSRPQKVRCTHWSGSRNKRPNKRRLATKLRRFLYCYTQTRARARVPDLVVTSKKTGEEHAVMYCMYMYNKRRDDPPPSHHCHPLLRPSLSLPFSSVKKCASPHALILTRQLRSFPPPPFLTYSSHLPPLPPVTDYAFYFGCLHSKRSASTEKV